MTNLTIQLTKAQTELMQNGEEVIIKPFKEVDLPVYLKYKRNPLVVKYTPKTLTVEVLVAGGGWCVGEIADLNPGDSKGHWITLPYSTNKELYHGQAVWCQDTLTELPTLGVWDAINNYALHEKGTIGNWAHLTPVDLPIDDLPNTLVKERQKALYTNLKD